MTKIITDYKNKKAAVDIANQLIRKHITDSGKKAEARNAFIEAYDQQYKFTRRKIESAIKTKSEQKVSAASRGITKLCPYFNSGVFVFTISRSDQMTTYKTNKGIFEEQKGAMQFLGRKLAVLLAVGDYALANPLGVIMTRMDMPMGPDYLDAFKTFAESCLKKTLLVDTSKLKERFKFIAVELAANIKKQKKDKTLTDILRDATSQEKMIAYVEEVAGFFK